MSNNVQQVKMNIARWFWNYLKKKMLCLTWTRHGNKLKVGKNSSKYPTSWKDYCWMVFIEFCEKSNASVNVNLALQNLKLNNSKTEFQQTSNPVQQIIWYIVDVIWKIFNIYIYIMLTSQTARKRDDGIIIIRFVFSSFFSTFDFFSSLLLLLLFEFTVRFA